MRIHRTNGSILGIVLMLSVAGCAAKSTQTAVKGPDANARAAQKPAATAQDQAVPAPAPSGQGSGDLSFSPVYFGYDSAVLSSEARATLQEGLRMLRQNASLPVVIEGHCDERGTEEYNLALGERRAAAVRRFLVDAGLPASRLRIISYGKERPVALGSDEQAWALNRRAQLTPGSN